MLIQSEVIIESLTLATRRIDGRISLIKGQNREKLGFSVKHPQKTILLQTDLLCPYQNWSGKIHDFPFS